MRTGLEKYLHENVGILLPEGYWRVANGYYVDPPNNNNNNRRPSTAFWPTPDFQVFLDDSICDTVISAAYNFEDPSTSASTSGSQGEIKLANDKRAFHNWPPGLIDSFRQLSRDARMFSLGIYEALARTLLIQFKRARGCERVGFGDGESRGVGRCYGRKWVVNMWIQ
ncbi:hypothetical protein CPB84DRAFT_128794 [Gymnopilus junonius]|uniref:Uncharacterized protein n=1 Tax=Gymnopilus junonius TaxID=109634 RepID=A0A9P5NEE8_GYMJU|nr:hypothetical protein CPB84DRAFT_128794 [Gymnopilus junonius]